MRYEYKCDTCNNKVSIEKQMSLASRPEYCEKCNEQLIRVYTNFGSKTNDGFKS